MLLEFFLIIPQPVEHSFAAFSNLLRFGFQGCLGTSLLFFVLKLSFNAGMAVQTWRTLRATV